MPATPARQERERSKRAAEMEAKAAVMEGKFAEFAASCEAGSVGGCTSLGEWYALMRHDYAAAAALYAPACLQGGYPQACWNLGNMLAAGKPGVRPDVPLATAALGLACDAGNAAACYTVGRLLLSRAANTGGVGGEPQSAPAVAGGADVAAAERYLSLGCCTPRTAGASDAGDACFLLAGLRLDPRFSGAVGRPVAAAAAAAAVRGGNVVSSAVVPSTTGREGGALHGPLMSPLNVGPSVGGASERPDVPPLGGAAIPFAAATTIPLAAAGGAAASAATSPAFATAGSQHAIRAARAAAGDAAARHAASLSPVELLHRGCDAASSKACKALAQLFASGDPSAVGEGAGPDSVQARAYLRRALLVQGHSVGHVERELARAGL